MVHTAQGDSAPAAEGKGNHSLPLSSSGSTVTNKADQRELAPWKMIERETNLQYSIGQNTSQSLKETCSMVLSSNLHGL